MPVVDQGAPTGGRGIKLLTSQAKITEATDLINEVIASNVNRTAVKNSLYTSKNFHIDAVPIGGKGAKRCKVEVQEQKGDKDTIAVAVLETHVNSDADVRTALINSLGNQHVWGVS
jgi:hypothetical protein